MFETDTRIAMIITLVFYVELIAGFNISSSPWPVIWAAVGCILSAGVTCALYASQDNHAGSESHD